VTNGLAANRLVFGERCDYDDYLQRLTLADLYLDTLPHNAGGVAMDALWMGCPVLTCPGVVLQSRIGAGMVKAAGLAELVVDTLADYEALAIKLGRTPQKMATLKDRLRSARDTQPMFNPKLLVRHLEWAYRAMWQRHMKGLPPALIDVPEIV
jgi:protein O-GlcNAc transferase